jgi:LPS export ABC transporter protein LptC
MLFALSRGKMMSRDQVRFLLAAATLLLMVSVGYYLIVGMQARRDNERLIEKLAGDITPQDEHRMQHFRRTKMHDGKKVWEVAARQARYSQEEGKMVIESPEVSLYLGNGDVIALRCQEGRIHMGQDGKEVSRMELTGDLHMQIGDFSLTGEEAIYESARNVVFSPTPVQIIGRGLTVVGRGYQVDVANKRVTLDAEVQTTLTNTERP